MGPVSAEVEIDVPRERAFEAIGDFSRRLVLHRPLRLRFPPDADRRRPGSAPARGSGSRPRSTRSGWTRRSSRCEEPHRIVEHGRGGRDNRTPTTTVWELTEGPGSLTTVRVSHWTEPSHPVDRALEALGATSIWLERDWREALRRLRDLLESGAPARAGSPSPGATVTRPASLNRLSPPMLPATADSSCRCSPRSCSPRSSLAVSACGYSSDSKDVVEGETVTLGELDYTVIFSRYLNPNDNEDSAYLVGQPEAPAGLHLLRRLLRGPERKRQEPADAAEVADDHRRPATRSTTRSPAKASTPSRSAAKSNPRNRSRCSTRPPSRGRSRAPSSSSCCPHVGLRQPAADALDPGARRARRSQARPLAAPAG